MAAGAATAMMMEKLHNLRSLPERAERLLLRKHIEDKAMEKLQVVYKFLSEHNVRLKYPQWLDRLLRTLYDAEEFIDLFCLKVAQRQNKTFHVIPKKLVLTVWKVLLRKRMAKFIEDMEGLLQEQHIESGHAVKEKNGGEGYISTLQCERGVRLDSFLYYQRFETPGFRQKITKVYERLQAEPVAIILGEQGSGKTFLARAIYKQLDLKHDLYRRAWVHMSDDMDDKHLCFQVLKQLGKVFKHKRDYMAEEIKWKLLKKLMRKRFLIVLDGVSEINQMNSLLQVLPNCQGSHVIITTRSEKVAHFLCCPPIELEKLSEEESKKLFHPIVLGKLSEEERKELFKKKLRKPGGGTVEITKDQVQDMETMIQNCNGSPLAISLWAGLWPTVSEPEKRLKALERGATLPQILELSYDSLPLQLKPCFLYMALLPKAFPIPLRRLVRLWLAEGLLNHPFDEERTLKDRITPEDIGEMYILELMRRNLIEVTSWKADGTPKTCQMVTSLYDIVSSTAIEPGLLHIHNKKEEQNDRNQQSSKVQTEQFRVRWLGEHTNILARSSCSLEIHHVRSFLSFNTRRGTLSKDVGTFLWNVTSQDKYSLLKVLDLEGVYKPNLQDALKKLLLLKYLGLRSTVLDSIPDAVAQLPYLETLDMKYTNITHLPSSFWSAAKLRHLHLNWFYHNLESIFKTCSDNPGALSNLQTLTGLVGCDVKNQMSDHPDKLATLTDLELYLQCTDGKSENGGIAEWIETLTNLQSLKLGTIKEAKMASLPSLCLSKHPDLRALYLLGKLPEDIKWNQLLPQSSLRVLTLSGSMVGDKCIQYLSHLRNLRTLRLLAKSFMGEELNFNAGFDNLRVLKIWKLSVLKTVIIGQKAMPDLQEVELRFLKSLEMVKSSRKFNMRVVYEEDRGFVKHFKETLNQSTMHFIDHEKKNPKCKVLVYPVTGQKPEEPDTDQSSAQGCSG